MANRTVRINLDNYYDFGDYLLRSLKPVGAFEVTAVRYYCTTVDVADIYVEATIHAYNTNWSYGETPYGEYSPPSTNIRCDPIYSGDNHNSWFLVDGDPVELPAFTGQAYSAAHVFNGPPNPNGAILFQADKVTGAVSTKVSSSPQGYLTWQAAVAALPAPDSGCVKIGYQYSGGPWTANTSNAIAMRVRSSVRDDGSNTSGMNDWLEFSSGVTRNPTLWGAPETESPGNECIVVYLIAYNDVNFTGAWIEVDFTDESSDTYTTRGEARASATVGYTTAPASYIGGGSRGEGRAVARVVSDAYFSAASGGQSRGQARVRTPGVGTARLDALTSEVLYEDDRGPARTTTHGVNLLGYDEQGKTKATHFDAQLAGRQDPEEAKAKVTHETVQQGGRQNPEDMAFRMTWLSVQVLRYPGPPIPLPPIRPGGCTMYNVIRAGEEESGQNAVRGTYRRLSGDIFLYRRELLQRLRMAYFDAEDYSFTLTIPQGGP